MFCRYCGAEINDNAVVCVKCGCAVNSNAICARQYDTAVYILLGVFFGVFGAHNFYIGKTKLAVIQLLLTVGSFFILAFPVSIWAIVEVCINARKLNS